VVFSYHARAEWPHQEIGNYRLSLNAAQMLRMAAARYGEESFRQAIRTAPRHDVDRDYAPLLFYDR
jgi:hypothetical protein